MEETAIYPLLTRSQHKAVSALFDQVFHTLLDHAERLSSEGLRHEAGTLALVVDGLRRDIEDSLSDMTMPAGQELPG